MNRQTEIVKHLSNKGEIYELKVGSLKLEMTYSKNQKKIDECILNILKQKKQKG